MAKNAHTRPWNPQLPIRDVPAWPHFLKAAEIIIELKTSVEEYVQAQWSCICRMARRKGDRVLFPAMLGTDNARLRFAEWQSRQEGAQRRFAKPRDHAVATDSREEKKLEKLAKQFDVKPDALLRMQPTEFSRAFLRAKGAWKDVAAEYEAALASDE